MKGDDDDKKRNYFPSINLFGHENKARVATSSFVNSQYIKF